MCGLAGYIGEKKISDSQISACHLSMNRRGPDSKGHVHFKFKKKNIYLLHNRLKIIDLSDQANQPYTRSGYTLVFNGEIYNFKEIKKNLVLKGYKFKTNSDTEVLLTNFIHKKFKAFEDFEGMWSLAIWDDNSKQLILSRDRFGQKPLFYFQDNNQIYFSSQINQITAISDYNFKINNKKIFDYLGSGYRVLFKDDRTFYKKIKHFPPSSYAVIHNNNIIFKKYWKMTSRINSKIKYEDAKNKISFLVKKSIKNCLISDQQTSLMLSGGVDSNIILKSIKDLNHSDITVCSVLDSDSRYDESENINLSLQGEEFKKILINEKDVLKKNFLNNLRDKINFYSSPVLTISSYVSSFLQKKISESGIRVNLSGIGADEVFTGYYQHHAYFLKTLKDFKDQNKFNKHYHEWRKYIFPIVRNPFLKNEKKFLKKNYRSSLLNYLVNPNILEILKKKYSYKFFEEKCFNNLLKNRMFNELLFENIPTMLYEDDRNHMFNSIENRSPFLDKDLVEYAMSLPIEFLIKNGTAKFILRDSFKGKVNNKILFNNEKKGFNFNLGRLLKEKSNLDQIMSLFSSKNSPIYEFIDFKNFKQMLEKKILLNSENKFFFSLINVALFLENK